LGADCVDGQCQPITITKGRAAPTDIAVAAGTIYWIEQGTIANSGGDGAVLRASVDCHMDACVLPIATSRPALSAIIAGTEEIYWAEEEDGLGAPLTGIIWRWTLTDGRKPFATKQNRPRALALDDLPDPALYWGNAGTQLADGELRRAFLTNGTPGGVAIVPNQQAPLSILVDGTDIIWTNYGASDPTGTVMTADILGKGTQTLAMDQGIPRRAAVSPTHLYWVDYEAGTLMRANRDGTQSTAFVENLFHPSDLVLTSKWVIWAEAGQAKKYIDGRLAAKHLETGEVRVLADHLTFAYRLALDAKAVYWVNRGTLGADALDGSVMKVARPAE
jgi:hypothetical protein